MAVIVHHQGIADLFGIEIGTLDPERPDAGTDIENAVGMGADGRQRRRDVLDRKRGAGAWSRTRLRRCAARTQAGKATERERIFQETAAIHFPFPPAIFLTAP